MQGFYGLLITLSIFVIPLWLILHYRSKSIAERHGVPEAEINRLEQLELRIEKLMQRAEHLEQILDEERPGWRDTLRDKN
ncbi:MAG: envelope stress response membrane protein PspB [Gammaproteobacteria bacterium]|nr:envelope stress response membrane protein PspB [Gammaproteobacteria bacterium]